MRILQINSHHKFIGGAETYYLSLSDLLEKNGHQVAQFSMQDSGNKRSKWSEYFVSNVNFDSHNKKNSSSIKKLIRTTYSKESQRKIASLIEIFKPDIAHIHNLPYFITPAILPVLHKHHIPIVMTVHDYHIISPNFRLYDHGKINEKTKPNKYFQAFRPPYLHDSLSATLISVFAQYIQHVMSIYEKNVDVFICPSKFMRSKLEEYEFKAKKIIHLPNFVENPPKKTSDENIQAEYVLFYGSLNEAKGMQFLIRVARNLSSIPFVCIGKVDKSISIENLPKNMTVLPFQSKQKISTYLSRTSFVVVPSLWYENQPYAILESYIHEKPVIASKIGGIPEIVIDKKTGLLFEPGNLDQCTKTIKFLWENKQKRNEYGKNAMQYIKQKFNQDDHYKKVLKIYSDTIATNSIN